MSWFMPDSIVDAVDFFSSSVRRFAPTRFAARCALRSPSLSSGVLTLVSTKSRSWRFGLPADQSLRGGIRIPSWLTSLDRADMLPGATPPTSEWWARLTANPTNRSLWKIGETMVMSGRWVPPRYGSLRMTSSPSERSSSNSF